MNKPQPIEVSVSTVVPAATPLALYNLISDVTSMPKFSPETIAVSWVGKHSAPVVGAKFKGTNRLGSSKWSTKPTITIAEPGQAFSFKVPGKAGAEWTYEFAEVDGGTLVTESVRQNRPSPLVIRMLQRRAGVTDRAENLRASMHTTLARLSAAATSSTVAAA